MSLTHILGLDLGQSSDPTALCVLERTSRPGDGANAYACRHLRRWPLGTPYPQIVDDVAALAARPELQAPTLVCDQTGVGRAVVDMFRPRVACAFRPVTITAGATVTRHEGGEFHVPKKDLVATLQVLLGHRRLTVAASMPEAETLVRELQNFRVKVTAAANEVFASWREGLHDDLVLAVALAAWVGENALAGAWEPTDSPASRSMTAALFDEGHQW